MSFKTRFQKWAMKVVGIDSDLLADWNSVGWSTDNFDTLSREGYEHCATVYRCINLITKNAAKVVYGVYEDKDDELVLVPNHPFIEKLKRPNPMMGRASFIKNVFSGLLLGGRSFIWANKLDSGEVHEYWPIPPADVTIKWGEIYGTIAGYEWNYGGNMIPLPTEDVLYLWFPNPRSPMEHMSPLKAAAQEVDLTNEGLRWNVSLMRNYAKPSHYVTREGGGEFESGPLKNDQVNDIKAALRDEYSGSKNVGRVPIFRIPGLKMVPFGWNPQDMDWLKGIENADVRIANVYDVPPELVGAKKTYENFEVANKVLYSDAVIPLVEYLADELTNWEAIGLTEDEIIGVMREKIKALQDDQKPISFWVGKMVDAGVITRNEGRKELKYSQSEDPLADMLTTAKEVFPLDASQFSADDEGIES